MCASLFLQFSIVDLDEPLFQPFPSEVVFQQFEPHEVYEVPLILRNNDKVILTLISCNVRLVTFDMLKGIHHYLACHGRCSISIKLLS